MVGVEVDFVVVDSLKALEVYKSIFEIERIEVTSFPRGLNEVVFSLYGTRFHMLDENSEYGLVAPKADSPQSLWFNVVVEDISEAHKKALESGCKEIQPVKEVADYGVSNSIFADEFGYLWMLHQIHREVTFEERVQLAEK